MADLLGMNAWAAIGAAAIGVVLVYGVLLVGLWRYARAHPDTTTVRDALRLLPDILRLIRRLIADRDVPAGVRVRLLILLGYLLSPLDLIPDFIPVLGWADDAIVVAIVLRSTIKHAGEGALVRHWPGTPAGLQVVRALTGTAVPGNRRHQP